jgi:esterase/lipase
MDEAAQAVPKIRAPTLLLYGCKDQFVRPWMVAWVADHANREALQVRVYPDRYHWLLRDLHAESVIADVAEWTRRPDVAAGADAAGTNGRQAIDCPP